MSGALRVLVVDDERSIRDGVNLLLRDAGHAAEPAPDALAALRRLEEAHWDVVVTDLYMPGMSGLALTREVKRRCPAVAVVLMTAWDAMETTAKALAAGAAECLTKPLAFCDLERCLRRVCLRPPAC
jgi:DNA-binding NtrC family response regulator